VKILVLGVEFFMLRLVLSLKPPVLSPVRFSELTMKTAMLSPRHWVFMCLLVRSLKVLMLSLVLSIERFMPSLVLSVELVVHGLMFITTKKGVVMSKDERSRP